MTMIITGLHVTVGPKLSSYAHKGMEALEEKYMLHFLNKHVRFYKKGPLLAAEIEVNLGGTTEKKSYHTQTSGEAEDFFVAFDSALSTLHRAVAKHKKYLLDTHKGRVTKATSEARDRLT